MGKMCISKVSYHTFALYLYGFLYASSDFKVSYQ